MSASVEGHWDRPSSWLWSIRTADGLRSSKLKRVRITLMYACWESMIICRMRSRVILIPSNQVQGPKSVSLYISFISTLNRLMSSFELPVTKQLSTWTAKMMTRPSAHFLMKCHGQLLCAGIPAAGVLPVGHHTNFSRFASSHTMP